MSILGFENQEGILMKWYFIVSLQSKQDENSFLMIFSDFIRSATLNFDKKLKNSLLSPALP